MKRQHTINHRHITGQHQIPEPNHPNPDYPDIEGRHAFFTPPGTQRALKMGILFSYCHSF